MTVMLNAEVNLVPLHFCELICLCMFGIFRLKEINMSEFDASTYERFSGAVHRQVQSLRIILDSLQVNVFVFVFVFVCV